MSMINLGAGFSAILNPAANSAANAKTQGAMTGAAANYTAQNKDARESGKRRSQTVVGNSVRKQHAITDALKRPGRKGRA